MAKRKGSRWPKECPVFEVLRPFYPHDRRDVLVGVDVVGDLVACASPQCLHDFYVGGFLYTPLEIRPLTPAAREMLALVKP
jgi:hypothetical protein